MVSKQTQLLIDDRDRASRLVARTAANERQTLQFPEPIQAAICRRNGANYYRCALQVNTPFQDNFKGFESRHRRHSPAYQRDYALALAKACKKAGVDVVGICDHNSVAYLEIVRHELGQENLIVFPGFEIASTEGIHLLCLFKPDAKILDLDHLLTELGLPPKERWMKGEGVLPRQSTLAFPEIVERVQRQREGICIAAHAENENGLLKECAKTTRAIFHRSQFARRANRRAARRAGGILPQDSRQRADALPAQKAGGGVELSRCLQYQRIGQTGMQHVD